MDRRSEINRALTRVIVKRREDAGLSQEAVWTAAGYRKTPYRDREQNKVHWGIEDLIRVAEVLRTRAYLLLKEAEEIAAIPPGPDPNRATDELGAALGFGFE
ncbi:hypothetical protein [Nocardia brasiliensis]|uniref:hypothetical protein n=1 Tax=Nocardia brasiliensis TaxID=37326 RepID=UPI00245565CC|nr:hypothetical protein [Nocardia brasiliensis]